MEQSGAEAQPYRGEQAHDEQSDEGVHGAAECIAAARRPKLPAAAHVSRVRLRPAVGWARLTLMLCALFVRLGFWQWQRWVESDAAWTRFARGADALQPLGARAPEDVALYQRVSVTGRFDGRHQFLLDTLSYRGRPGYEVLTPFTRAPGALLLIDRGWVPFTGARARLPDVGLADEASRTVSGRIAELPRAGLASGRAAPNPLDPWP